MSKLNELLPIQSINSENDLLHIYDADEATDKKVSVKSLYEKSGIAADIENIEKLIPESTSETNKLVNKSYVDESIQTNTAVNRGSFSSYAALIAYSGIVTRNDYAYVADDETHNHEAWRYKWNDDEHVWKEEYRINESPMTQEQLAALNSGITEEKVQKLNNIESGAQKNIQPDWEQTDENADDYIKNKPTGISIDQKLKSDSENGIANKIVATNIGTFLNSQSKTAAKTIDLNDVELYDGFTCKIMFKNGHRGTSLTLNGKTVKVNRHGSLIAMPYHAINGYNEMVQPYTTLELVWSATDDCWIVIGNPVVLSASGSDFSYEIKSDGLITQRLIITPSNHGSFPLKIAFSNTFYSVLTNSLFNGNQDNSNPHALPESQTTIYGWGFSGRKAQVECTGY